VPEGQLYASPGASLGEAPQKQMQILSRLWEMTGPLHKLLMTELNSAQHRQCLCASHSARIKKTIVAPSVVGLSSPAVVVKPMRLLVETARYLMETVELLRSHGSVP